jgi:hypothetical protein
MKVIKQGGVGAGAAQFLLFYFTVFDFNKKIKLALMSTFPRTNLAGALG